MEHGAIFIPASPPSSGQPSPRIYPRHPFRTPIRSNSGSILIPASPLSSHPPSRKQTIHEAHIQAWNVQLPSPAAAAASSHATLLGPSFPDVPAIKTQLISFSTSILTSMARQDWSAAHSLSDLIDHSCYTAHTPDFVVATSYAEHIEQVKSHGVTFPGADGGLEKAECEVDLWNGVAKVVMSTAADFRSHAVMLFEWRMRGQGQWLCVRYEAVQGLNATAAGFGNSIPTTSLGLSWMSDMAWMF